MNNEKNTMQEKARTSRVPQNVQGFDPTKFAREGTDANGEKVLTLDLNHKKTWFRLACPNGGMVLNPLRVTDTMAIFEARVFADTGDGTPLASFTAVQSADKTTGKQYIRAAQDAALSEALDNAGFDIRLCGAAPAQDSGRFTHVRPLGEGETVQKAADTGEPAKAVEVDKPVTPPKQSTAPVQPVQPIQKNPAPVDTDKRPAPVGLQPRSTPAVLPVQKAAAEPVQPSTAPVVNIATGQPMAAQTAEPAKAESVPAAASAQRAPEPGGEETTPPTYNADMTVENICRVMTLEQARKLPAPSGIRKGWTLGQVADEAPVSLKWYRFTCPDADNIIKAASQLLLDDLKLKQAG